MSRSQLREHLAACCDADLRANLLAMCRAHMELDWLRTCQELRLPAAQNVVRGDG